MSHAEWAEYDTIKAKQFWREYQRVHDLSDRIGQTAGIDPHSGRVWIGESIVDVVSQRDADGVHSPLFFERIGFDAYFQKGRR